MGRLRERTDSAGESEKACCESWGDGIGEASLGSPSSSCGVGAALVATVVQLKWDMSGGLPPAPVAIVSVDCRFGASEGAAVDQLNLLCMFASGTASRSWGGGMFSLVD